MIIKRNHNKVSNSVVQKIVKHTCIHVSGGLVKKKYGHVDVLSMMSTNFHPVSKRLSGSSFQMMVAGCQLIDMKICERLKIACSGLCLPITHVYVVTFYIEFVCFKV